MKALLSDPDLVARQNAAVALGNLVDNNALNQDAIRKDGGIVPLVALLRDSDLDARRNAAGALLNLSANNVVNKEVLETARLILVN